MSTNFWSKQAQGQKICGFDYVFVQSVRNLLNTWQFSSNDTSLEERYLTTLER